MDKGALDMILDRRDLRERIADLLAILAHRPRYCRSVVPVV
jgi:acetyl-CoA carboxylase carboxyl transferase subunit beta